MVGTCLKLANWVVFKTWNFCHGKTFRHRAISVEKETSSKHILPRGAAWLDMYMLCPKSVVWCVPPTLKPSTCWWTWNFRWRIGKNHPLTVDDSTAVSGKKSHPQQPLFYPWEHMGWSKKGWIFSHCPMDPPWIHRAFATGALKVQVDHVCGDMANFGSGWW